MIIDFHTHIFPRQIREDRQRFFAGEPAFELLYAPEKSKMVSGADLVSAMDEDGVDRSVTFGFPWQDPDIFRMHNDYVLDQAARFPDRLIPYACFDVTHPDAAAEAERCLNAGAQGLGELALYKSGIGEKALDAIAPVMDLAAERNVPVLFHANEPVGHYYPGKTPVTPSELWALVTRFPNNRIVLAHWGGGVFFYALLKRGGKEAFQNVWLDTAASPYLYTPDIYKIASSILGPDKILLGSDYPLLRCKRYFKEIDGAGLNETERKALLGEAADELLQKK